VATVGWEAVMHIGKWTVRIEGWALVFERLTWSVCAGWVDLRKYYSAEDNKRWRDEFPGHIGGL